MLGPSNSLFWFSKSKFPMPLGRTHGQSRYLFSVHNTPPESTKHLTPQSHNFNGNSENVFFFWNTFFLLLREMFQQGRVHGRVWRKGRTGSDVIITSKSKTNSCLQKKECYRITLQVAYECNQLAQNPPMTLPLSSSLILSAILQTLAQKERCLLVCFWHFLWAGFW